MRWLGMSVTGVYLTDNIVDLGVPEMYEMYRSFHKDRISKPETEIINKTFLTYEEFIRDKSLLGIPKTNDGWISYKMLNGLECSDYEKQRYYLIMKDAQS
jgi:hypothetical protein